MPLPRHPSRTKLIAEIIRLGREGASRREMAAGVGVTFAAFEALVAADARVARALALAEEAARAWWDGLPRDALAGGARINMASWRGAMASRFGAAALGAPAPPPAPPPARRAIYELPDNGTSRRFFPEHRAPRDREEARHFVGLWELAMENAEHGLAIARQRLRAFPRGEDEDDDPGEEDFDATIAEEAEEWA